MKRAFLFPGQGAQSVGMGKDIYEKYEVAKKVYDEASRISGIDVKKICFEGPEEELNKTENTQIAILTTSLAMLEVLKQNGIEADVAVRIKPWRIWSFNLFWGINF
jgi:[acyl-carrier-protein] S-malonyltransferase